MKLGLTVGATVATLGSCEQGRAQQRLSVESEDRADRARASLRGRAEWWPFGTASASEPPPAHHFDAAPMVGSIQDVKDSVMMTAAFGHKTDLLCEAATAEDKLRCRQIA